MSSQTVLVTRAFGQVYFGAPRTILPARGRTVIALDVRNDHSGAAAASLAAESHTDRLIPKPDFRSGFTLDEDEVCANRVPAAGSGRPGLRPVPRDR